MKILVFFMLLFVPFTFWAQQDVQLTMYKFNQLQFNPAAAGAYEKFEFGLFGRHQWVGFDGAPITFGLSTSYQLASINSGIGIQYYHDQLGFEKNDKLAVAYSYQLPVGSGTLSFGLKAGIFHKKIDAIWITPDGTPWQNDPAIANEQSSGAAFDLDLGTLYQTENLQVSFSVSHILQQEIPNVMVQMARHYWLYANYDLHIGKSWQISPNLLVKSDAVSTQLDLNLYTKYNDFVWIGIGYRMVDAVMVSIGADIGQNFRAGYAYDITTSKLSNYSNGSHELFLAYRIPK